MAHAADNSSIETSKKGFFFMVIPPALEVRAAASGLHRDPWKCRAHYGVQLGETSSNEITDTDGGVSVLVSAFAAMEPGTGSPDGALYGKKVFTAIDGATVNGAPIPTPFWAY